jgi:hypothetical protein
MADSSEAPSSYTDTTLADTASPWNYSNAATYANASVNANANAATYANSDPEANPDSTSNPNSPSKQGYSYAGAS